MFFLLPAAEKPRSVSEPPGCFYIMFVFSFLFLGFLAAKKKTNPRIALQPTFAPASHVPLSPPVFTDPGGSNCDHGLKPGFVWFCCFFLYGFVA